jgi:hypothetical protein
MFARAGPYKVTDVHFYVDETCTLAELRKIVGPFVDVGLRLYAAGAWHPEHEEYAAKGLVDTGAPYLYLPINVAHAIGADRLMCTLPGGTGLPDGATTSQAYVPNVNLSLTLDKGVRVEGQCACIVLTEVRCDLVYVGLAALDALGVHLHVYGPEQAWGVGRMAACFRSHALPTQPREPLAVLAPSGPIGKTIRGR